MACPDIESIESGRLAVKLASENFRRVAIPVNPIAKQRIFQEIEYDEPTSWPA
jgi:hypothetical protein